MSTNSPHGDAAPRATRVATTDAQLGAPPPDVIALEATGIEKSFGGVHALRGAHVQLQFGKVHALVGENGAGKSTLIKILSGVLRPDAGLITVGGQEFKSLRSDRSAQLSIGTVFQELSLYPWMTVADNLTANSHRTLGILSNRRKVREAAATLERFGVKGIDPLEIPADLSVAQRQILEIVKVLDKHPRILLLDEPTAALPYTDVEWLFQQVDEMRKSGAAVAFTSHRWREVQELSDLITVYRSGRDVATRQTLSETEAVTLMTGREIKELYPPLRTVDGGADRPPALEVSKILTTRVHSASLRLNAGEVLGIGGLAGQGQREFFLALFGAGKTTGGSISVGGTERRIRSPRQAIEAGMGLALIPEDRKAEGLFLPLTVSQNLTLPVISRLSHGGIVKRREQARTVMRTVQNLQIRTARPDVQAVGTLSGGNQQKVLIGKWLLTEADVLLMYDITRGVDAATRRDLYFLIADLIQEGKSILLYSSDTDELVHLCHRVLIMREGRFVRELAGGELDAEHIVASAIGVE